jgi:hypothetical protein
LLHCDRIASVCRQVLRCGNRFCTSSRRRRREELITCQELPVECKAVPAIRTALRQAAPHASELLRAALPCSRSLMCFG